MINKEKNKMSKEKITTEVSNEETVTQNKEPDYFMDGMEYAYHEAIISLKKIHGYGSETVQALVGLIDQTWGFESNSQEDEDNEKIDEARFFADNYSDCLFAKEPELVELYGQFGFNFLVSAVLHYGGFDVEEIMRECE